MNVAVDDPEIGRLHYHAQPIVDAGAGGRVTGYELLLRRRTPEGEVPVPPDEMMRLRSRPDAAVRGLAERAGRAASLLLGTGPDVFVSLNVTERVLDAEPPAPADWIRRFLRGLPAERIVLEVVETARIDDLARTVRALQRLRGEGVRIAIDDYGAGLSDMTRLRALPLDIVKLDRALVREGARRPAALREVVAEARGRGLAVIAEGVETTAEQDAMRALGLTLQQGFLHARPAPPEAWGDRARRPTRP